MYRLRRPVQISPWSNLKHSSSHYRDHSIVRWWTPQRHIVELLLTRQKGVPDKAPLLYGNWNQDAQCIQGIGLCLWKVGWDIYLPSDLSSYLGCYHMYLDWSFLLAWFLLGICDATYGTVGDNSDSNSVILTPMSGTWCTQSDEHISTLTGSQHPLTVIC